MASPLAHSDDNRPKKRQRTEQDAASAQPTIKKSDVVWMSDGNLIIRTVEVRQDSPTVLHTLYRVHKSVLALNCGAFAAMFDGDQAAFEAASERFEGVPVMELPDPAEDVKAFLDAMYHPKQLRNYGSAIVLISWLWEPFPESYCGVLRLANKYNAQDMHEQVAAALETRWPKKLSAWDEAEMELLPGEYQQPGKYIRLATAGGTPGLLPAMFYALARDTDNFVTVISSQANKLSERKLYEADLALLTAGELHRLIIGKTDLREFVAQQVRAYDKGVDMACGCEREKCRRAGNSWWKANLVHLEPGYLESLARCKDRVDKIDGKTPLCDRRMEYLENQIERIRQATWDALPKLFGIAEN
ncbi:hypothetical protein FA95DRAFT_1607275 [Auriscalpium vulgare]|uniref:Uncharacterized protein n=1 Tax=Auriscalpium vulgare TaxID=40419 RepID=A0ACB8RQX4_9AGAM|nr:hypothetical protein FA95DRAFT_1607275 [Auriscalpium vulgare]